MKFSYQNTVHLNTDITSAWNAITHPHFERDFLPEVRHGQTLATVPVETISGQLLRWRATDDTTIKLTRTDLNVVISTVEIRLKPLSNGVAVTMKVDYAKRFESKFVKAHLAVRGLFNEKLSVLKADFAPRAHNFAFR